MNLMQRVENGLREWRADEANKTVLEVDLTSFSNEMSAVLRGTSCKLLRPLQLAGCICAEGGVRVLISRPSTQQPKLRDREERTTLYTQKHCWWNLPGKKRNENNRINVSWFLWFHIGPKVIQRRLDYKTDYANVWVKTVRMKIRSKLRECRRILHEHDHKTISVLSVGSLGDRNYSSVCSFCIVFYCFYWGTIYLLTKHCWTADMFIGWNIHGAAAQSPPL